MKRFCLVAITALTFAAQHAWAADAPRLATPLMTDWSFHKGAMEMAEATAPGGGAEWQKVTLPHTWNALDGQDGGAPYFRGDGWYRRTVAIPSEMEGRQLFLRFEGANRRAEVFVNGQSAGKHTGGTQAFVLDVTGLARVGQENQLTVHVDNKNDPDSAPLQADFTFFGGLYRGVELVAVNPLHVDLSDHGSPGVYVTTPEITDEMARVHVRTLLKNERPHSSKGNVLLQIFDAKGVQVAEANSAFAIDAGKQIELAADTAIAHPHRWNGRLDPYLYTLKTSILSTTPEGAPITTDAIAQPLGVRTIAMDPEKGFMLNGKPYPLHGVNRHQDRKDKGWAISNADHDQDMALIKEMGCTGIRLAHYQHAEYFYQLCDREGMVVWAEIPVVDRLGASQAFTDNARQQYTELIRQNFNHPSIAFWSAGNEVDDSGGNFNKAGPQVYPWFQKMGELGKQEDPSRFTASAYREKFFPPAVTDVIGMNIYLGWYNNTFEEIEQYITKHHESGIKGKWAVTEYGAGASIYFHSEKPVRMDHTEEYQALYHEKNWQVLKQHPEVWGKFIWNMFDFAVDGRFEGDRGGINDKGLVTQDRKVKKDAFYFYKANWSAEPTVWLAGKRFEVRGLEKIPVKAYSNALTVSLTVNGTAVGEKKGDNATFVWDEVALKPGENVVVAKAVFPAGETVTDTATWTYTPGAPSEVYAAQDPVMKKALEAGPPRVGTPRKPGGAPASRPASRPAP